MADRPIEEIDSKVAIARGKRVSGNSKQAYCHNKKRRQRRSGRRRSQRSKLLVHQITNKHQMKNKNNNKSRSNRIGRELC